MVKLIGCVLASLVVLACASSASAEVHRIAQTAPGVAPSSGTARTLTGKERLGPKWTDEQRIDNCNVPVDKRGTRPRPAACPNRLIN